MQKEIKKLTVIFGIALYLVSVITYYNDFYFSFSRRRKKIAREGRMIII